jgi:lambda repressor-like predicted transcriptional regulator
MSSSKHHKRKLAAALRMMGTSLATHTESTFKPSGAASRTLEEFKARRAAEKLGLLPAAKHKVAERYEIDVDTAQVTKLPVRAKSR